MPTLSLVLWIDSRCRYCTENMPLYREIAAISGTTDRSLRVVAAGIEPVATLSKYVADHGVAVDHISSIEPGKLRVRGTPTLILVNRAGIVEQVWGGYVQPERQRDLVGWLKERRAKP